MRKEAHDKKKKKETKQQKGGCGGGGASSSSASPSLSNSSSSSSGSPGVDSTPAVVEANERGFYDTGGFEAPRADNGEKMSGGVKVYSMDEIWKAIESPENQESVRNPDFHGGDEGSSMMGSLIWDDYSVWTMDYDYQEDQSTMVAPTVSDQIYSWFDNIGFAHNNNTFLTG